MPSHNSDWNRLKRSYQNDLHSGIKRPSRPVEVAWGKKQELTTLKVTAPKCLDLGSLSGSLAAVSETKVAPQPNTQPSYKKEFHRNRVASKQFPHFARDDETQLAPVQKGKVIVPVPVAINIDGVDMKFDAIVVVEEHF